MASAPSLQYLGPRDHHPRGDAVDIAAWLRGAGLERYEPALREHEIDWEVLPELTQRIMVATTRAWA